MHVWFTFLQHHCAEGNLLYLAILCQTHLTMVSTDVHPLSILQLPLFLSMLLEGCSPENGKLCFARHIRLHWASTDIHFFCLWQLVCNSSLYTCPFCNSDPWLQWFAGIMNLVQCLWCTYTPFNMYCVCLFTLAFYVCQLVPSCSSHRPCHVVFVVMHWHSFLIYVPPCKNEKLSGIFPLGFPLPHFPSNFPVVTTHSSVFFFMTCLKIVGCLFLKLVLFYL